MKTENIIIFVLVVAVVVLAYLHFGGTPAGALSADEVTESALAFINDYMLEPGNEAKLVGEVTEERGLYKFTIQVAGQDISSYITKDGVLLFPQEGIDLEQARAELEQARAESEEPQQESETTELSYDENGNIRGEGQAPVTIIEFSDFQCPYCSRFHDTMKQVMEEYPSEVKWVYRHFPLDSIHPYARQAAEASECAAEQGKFWQYADGLYEGQLEISPRFLEDLSSQLGLNTDQFGQCLEQGKYANKVEADYQAGIAAGVSGTPGSFINGEALGGAVPFATLQAEIDALLAE